MDIERVGIIGLGYVGLPTAIAFHKAGFSVSGVDISRSTVEKIIDGFSPLIDQTEKLDIPKISERWQISTDYMSLFDCDVVLITVPTPVTKSNEPDLSYVESASRSILEIIPKGKRKIIVLESTVYPGVTRNILGGLCDDLGLTLGADVILAYCPERIDPGTEMNVGNIARIVGCDDSKIGSLLAGISTVKQPLHPRHMLAA